MKSIGVKSSKRPSGNASNVDSRWTALPIPWAATAQARQVRVSRPPYASASRESRRKGRGLANRALPSCLPFTWGTGTPTSRPWPRLRLLPGARSRSTGPQAWRESRPWLPARCWPSRRSAPRRSRKAGRGRGGDGGGGVRWGERGGGGIKRAGGARRVDWRQVEDAVIAKSLTDDQQPADEVYRAIASASPGALTDQQQAALRERIDSAARVAQGVDRDRGFSM